MVNMKEKCLCENCDSKEILEHFERCENCGSEAFHSVPILLNSEIKKEPEEKKE